MSSNEGHDAPGGSESAVSKQRPTRTSRPANVKRPSGARPLVVASDLDAVSTEPIALPSIADESPPPTSSNGSHNGDLPTVEMPIEASTAPVPAPAALKTESSRKRRSNGAAAAALATTEAVGLATPEGPTPIRPTALAPAGPPPPLVFPHPIEDEPTSDYPEVDREPSTVTKGRTIIRYGPGGRRRRPRVRRVTRVIRHVDPWSVFKVALFFSFVLYGICLTAGVLLWNVAYTTGTIDNIERFFESFGWDTFQFKGGELYHNAWIAGLFGAIGLTGLIVLGATLFNLITDLVGGIRVTVLEEEVVERHPAVTHSVLRRKTGEVRMVSEVHQTDPPFSPAPNVETTTAPPAPAPPPGFLS